MNILLHKNIAVLTEKIEEGNYLCDLYKQDWQTACKEIKELDLAYQNKSPTRIMAPVWEENYLRQLKLITTQIRKDYAANSPEKRIEMLNALPLANIWDKLFNPQQPKTYRSHPNLHQDQTAYVSSHYQALAITGVLLKERFPENSILLDVGCGTGITLNVWSSLLPSSFSLLGVEIDPICFDLATINISKNKLASKPIELFQKDILELDTTILDTVNIFYLFHPFGEETFTQFLETLLQSKQRADRQLSIIYNLSKHKELLLANGFIQDTTSTHIDLFHSA